MTAFAASSQANLQFRNIANKLGIECPRPESPSTGRKTDHARSSTGSTSYRRKYRTSATSGWSACARWATRLRRPEADFLRDGIYELRVSLGGVHHRILYFFHGAIAAVVSHGLVKERVVPSKEIDHAVERKKRFEANPAKHTYEEA